MKQARKIVVIAISFAMAVAFMPIDLHAAAKTSNKMAGAIKSMQLKGDTFDYAEGDEADGQYPAYIDLTDGHIMEGLVDGYDKSKAKDVISSVKLQNPFGTCWGFAATAAAEGSIVYEEKYDGATVDNSVDPDDSKYDFSEKYLAWFAKNAINDKNDDQNGEGLHWKTGTKSSDKYVGGLPFVATSVYAAGLGPVPESKYPYSGANKNIYQIKKDGKLFKLWYSENDDWSIPESARWKQSYELQESYMLPTPAGTDENGKYQYNEDGTNAIKDQLKQGRPVQIGFCADQSQPNEKGEGKYLNENSWAHYTYKTDIANHAVTIVGYYDDFSKKNFNSKHRPPANGAWLVKNSWGSAECEFPNYGYGDWGIKVSDGKGGEVNSGYFWISYYDKTLLLPEALDFAVGDEYKDDYVLDEYDLMPVNTPASFTSSIQAKMANVFTVDCSEKIYAVSTTVATPGTSVKYQIYLLQKDATEPTDGVLLYTGTETYDYGGFHRHELPKSKRPVIQKDQKYSVVVEQVAPGGNNEIMLNASNNGEEPAGGYECWFEGVINGGESYLCLGGEWADWKDVKDELLEGSFGDDAKNMAVDNFPIKAFAKETGTPYFEPSDDPFIIDGSMIGEEADFRLDIIGPSYEGNIGTITWKSSNKNVVSVEPKSNDTRCTVTVNGYGNAILTAKEKNLGTAIVKVRVSPTPVSKITVKKGAKSATVTWNDIICDGYKLRYKMEGKSSWNVKYVASTEKDKAIAEIKNLKGGKKYTFKVASYGIAKNGKKVLSAYSPAKTVTVRPGVVKGLKVTAGKNKATLKWKNTGDQGYRVVYKAKGAKSWKYRAVKASSKDYKTYTIKNLKGGKTYYFKVAAYDKKTTGDKIFGKYTEVKTVKIKK